MLSSNNVHVVEIVCLYYLHKDYANHGAALASKEIAAKDKNASSKKQLVSDKARETSQSALRICYPQKDWPGL